MYARTPTLLLVLAAGLLSSATVLAQPAGGPGGAGGQGGPGGEKRRGPPPESIEACKGKAAGAVCNFVNREGASLAGTCYAPPPRPDEAGKSDAPARPLACRPDRGPGGNKAKG